MARRFHHISLLTFAVATLAGCQARPAAPTFALGATGADRQTQSLTGALDTGVVKPLCQANALGLTGPLLCTPAPTPTPGCGTQPYAVFAHSDKLPLLLAGVGDVIQGPVHTNRATWMVGVNEHIVGRDEAVSGYHVLGLTEDAGQRVSSGAMDFPEARLTADAFGTPTFSFTGDVDLALVPSVWAAPGRLKPGVYRATGRILLTALGATGQVTFVAKGVSLLGANMTLTPYAQGVLAFSDGHLLSRDIELGALNNRLTGKLIANDGAVLVAGVSNQLTGSVYAQVFALAGSLNRIVAPAAAGCSPTPGAPGPTATPVAQPTQPPAPSPTPVPSPSATPQPQETPGGGTGPGPSSSPSTPPASSAPDPGTTSGDSRNMGGYGNLFGLAFDPAGNLWAGAGGNQGVGIEFDAAGNQLGTNTLGINSWGVAIEPANGRVWYTDQGSGTITVLNADRSLAFQANLGGITPEGIVFDASGHPLITDLTNNAVDQLDPSNGAVLASYPVGVAPRDLALDGNGHIWVTNKQSDTVMQLAPTGEILATYQVGQGPSCIKRDPQGNFWVTNTGPDIPYPDGYVPGNTVTKLSATGELLGTFTVGNSPWGVDFDRQGNALVVNTGSDSVSKLSSTGAPLATYTNGLGHQPYNLALDRQGFAWISNHYDGTLTRLYP